MKKLLEKLLVLDRRWIFLIIGLVVILAFVFDFPISIGITKPVQDFYDIISQAEEDEPILVSFDLGPSTLPELEPMLHAVIRHALLEGKKVIGVAMLIQAPGIAERILVDVTESLNEEFKDQGLERRIRMGEDWVFLGFRAGASAVILGLGEEVRNVFPTDYYGTHLNELPMMDDVHNFDDMSAVVTISGTQYPELWVMYAGGPYGIPVLVGVTAVMAPNYYAYLQTGQMSGMLGGLKGASEYERLMDFDGMATKGMVAQLWVHIAIVTFILLGNIAYFLTRKKKKLNINR
ncbi:MAG: hypothetical protein GF399_10065 [Candidatus Coatesbacteria bacterium]|jgi:hypothetical protein|nr:hypothetical protein [Candidatus Coatesbacteria bacterium]